MKKYIFKSALFALLVASMVSCYPGGPESVQDFDVTYTHIVDPDFDWNDKSKMVYFMPDTVLDLSDPDDAPNAVTNGKELLAQVASNMNDYGFMRETDTANIEEVDFLVLVSTSRTNNYYYSWWGGWYDYWPYYWGGCCYYPPYTTVSNFRTGSLLVEIIDAKSLDPNIETIPIIWRGIGEGLYEGSNSNINARAKASVDKMFELTPELNRQ